MRGAEVVYFGLYGGKVVGGGLYDTNGRIFLAF